MTHRVQMLTVIASVVIGLDAVGCATESLADGADETAPPPASVAASLVLAPGGCMLTTLQPPPITSLVSGYAGDMLPQRFATGADNTCSLAGINILSRFSEWAPPQNDASLRCEPIPGTTKERCVVACPMICEATDSVTQISDLKTTDPGLPGNPACNPNGLPPNYCTATLNMVGPSLLAELRRRLKDVSWVTGGDATFDREVGTAGDAARANACEMKYPRATRDAMCSMSTPATASGNLSCFTVSGTCAAVPLAPPAGGAMAAPLPPAP